MAFNAQDVLKKNTVQQSLRFTPKPQKSEVKLTRIPVQNAKEKYLKLKKSSPEDLVFTNLALNAMCVILHLIHRPFKKNLMDRFTVKIVTSPKIFKVKS